MSTPADPAELLKSNQFDEAVQAALEIVKKKPADAGLRMMLAELLCLSGDYERADKQLDAASTQAPESAVRSALLRQLIRAATARQECFDAGRPPELLESVDDSMDQQMRLLLAVREQNWAEAAELASAREESRKGPAAKGPDWQAADVRDQDDLWAGILELLTSTGKYYWVPLSAVETLSVHPPATPSELIWPVADIAVANGGPTGRVYLPAVYPAFGEELDPATRLGRETRWRELHDGFALGVGLRVWWLDNDERTLFELNDVEFGAEQE